MLCGGGIAGHRLEKILMGLVRHPTSAIVAPKQRRGSVTDHASGCRQVFGQLAQVKL